jgi:predicted RNA-binding protein (virulence factor B family)
VGLQVFATDLNDTAVQDMMKNHIAVALDTLEMTEEDLDLKYSKKAEKTAVTIEAERISKLTFDKRIPALLKAGIITSESTYKMGRDLDFYKR